VIDADALTVFEGNQGKLFDALGPNDVITPHLGEFARLFPDIDADNTDEAALRAAQRTECTVVLKSSSGTVVASPQGETVSPQNAPAWIGTAGAGDSLTGMIAGLMAQGMPPFKAAATALWIGNEAARLFGPGMIADDMVDTIPSVIKKLYE
jgi:NAD(P)H-hydrate epimerase